MGAEMMRAPLHNDRFLRALRRETTDTTPIWVMRQAGRYLPEYRATRERAGSFMALAQNPELACEVTLQPLARFDLDAAILFSDILTIPDAMGLGLSFVHGEGPQFARPLRTAADIARLAVPDMDGELRYVMDAVRLIRRELHGRVPLIGFSGSPWTLACYMVEGQGSKDFARAKALCWSEPQAAHQLLDILARAVAHYLIAQARAGAQALMIFDTWGGMLGPAPFREFSLRYMQQIVAALHADPTSRDIPVILFSKGAGQHLAEMADRYGEPPVQVQNLIAVSKLRRMAQKAGLSEVVVVGSNLRVVGSDLADSVQVRLQRMYPGARYLRAAKAVMAPMPNLQDTDDAALLAWTSQLLVAIFGAEVLTPAPSQSGDVAS